MPESATILSCELSPELESGLWCSHWPVDSLKKETGTWNYVASATISSWVAHAQVFIIVLICASITSGEKILAFVAMKQTRQRRMCRWLFSEPLTIIDAAQKKQLPSGVVQCTLWPVSCWGIWDKFPKLSLSVVTNRLCAMGFLWLH